MARNVCRKGLRSDQIWENQYDCTFYGVAACGADLCAGGNRACRAAEAAAVVSDCRRGAGAGVRLLSGTELRRDVGAAAAGAPARALRCGHFIDGRNPSAFSQMCQAAGTDRSDRAGRQHGGVPVLRRNGSAHRSASAGAAGGTCRHCMPARHADVPSCEAPMAAGKVGESHCAGACGGAVCGIQRRICQCPGEECPGGRDPRHRTCADRTEF